MEFHLYSEINQETSGAQKLTDVYTIYQSIYNILSTSKGSRFFNPEFGVNLNDSIFELMTEIALAQIYDEIVAAIERWEHRVVIDYGKTQVVENPDDHRYDILIVFNIIGLDNSTFEYKGAISE